MKSHTYWASALLVLALALWCTLGVSAEDTTTTASGTAGSFQLEQVYVNAPELDVYFYATDANGESYSPIVVQAQGVEATLGDRKLDTGMIGVAEDPICYIIALDNSTSIDAEDFHKMRTAIWTSTPVCPASMSLPRWSSWSATCRPSPICPCSWTPPTRTPSPMPCVSITANPSSTRSTASRARWI